MESDDGVFPYTSIELMAIADLCIHFQSGAVLEAAHAGVPSLSVRVPQSHLEEYPGHDELFGGTRERFRSSPASSGAWSTTRRPRVSTG